MNRDKTRQSILARLNAAKHPHRDPARIHRMILLALQTKALK